MSTILQEFLAENKKLLRANGSMVVYFCGFIWISACPDTYLFAGSEIYCPQGAVFFIQK